MSNSPLDGLTWLHVSDFHFTATGDRFGQKVACNALLEDVKSRLVEHAPFAFVLVTGDIAFSDQPDQYSEATRFLGQLAEPASVDVTHFFFVPGDRPPG